MRGNFYTRNATPTEYLTRLRLANAKLGDAIRFLGLVVTAAGWQLVTSQPNVPGGPPSPHDVEQFFRWNRFRQVNEKTYYRADDNLLVGDAHTGNLKLTVNGDVVPFDLLLCEPHGPLRRSVEEPPKLVF